MLLRISGIAEFEPRDAARSRTRMPCKLRHGEALDVDGEGKLQVGRRGSGTRRRLQRYVDTARAKSAYRQAPRPQCTWAPIDDDVFRGDRRVGTAPGNP